MVAGHNKIKSEHERTDESMIDSVKGMVNGNALEPVRVQRDDVEATVQETVMMRCSC
jgi:hypothetical protein